MLHLYSVFYLNEIGKRSNIEDAIFPKPGKADITDRIFIVCDGVGGSDKGEVASETVSTTIGNLLQESKHPVLQNDVRLALKQAIANMHDYIKLDASARNMATTLTLAVIQTNSVLLGWCGDSRIMHIRNGMLQYQTVDHSTVMQLVKQGEITAEDAATHPLRHQILRSVNALGQQSEPEFHTLEDIKENDYLLLCTDGVLENLNENNIPEIFGTNGNENVNTIEQRLRGLTFGKTSDNYSLYLLKIKGSPKSQAAIPAADTAKKKPIIAFLLFLIIFAGIALFIRKAPQQAKPADSKGLKNADSAINKSSVAKDANAVSVSKDSGGIKAQLPILKETEKPVAKANDKPKKTNQIITEKKDTLKNKTIIKPLPATAAAEQQALRDSERQQMAPAIDTGRQNKPLPDKPR